MLPSSMVEDLLAQIRATPDDDALRMVYADELLARGDERGEYIQLDLARAHRLTREQRARWIELREHQERWAAELGCGETKVLWRRLAISASQLYEGGARALARVQLPSLDDLTFYGAELRGHLRVGLSNPRIGELRRLWITDENLRGVELPLFTNLVDLGLTGCRLEHDLASFVARSWPTLVTLDLSGNPIRDPGAYALARSETLPKLTRLSLMNTPTGAVGFKRRTGLPALEELWLGAVHASDHTWHAEEVVRAWFDGTNLVVL
jgi:uncharacterized protein (TIGR02996 family)